MSGYLEMEGENQGMEDNREERQIALKLSEKDYKGLLYKAARCGLSVGELLEAFVGDLVDGQASSGSDERMYIAQWFNRCRFSNGWDQPRTYLHYLLQQGLEAAEKAAEDWRYLKETREELEDAKSGDWAQPSEIDEMESEYEEAAGRIFDRYQEYAGYISRYRKEDGYSLEEFSEELQKVGEWCKCVEGI